MAKIKKNKFKNKELLGVLGLASSLLVLGLVFKTATASFKASGKVLSQTTIDMTADAKTAAANQDGTAVTMGGSQVWMGTGQSAASSYLGLTFSGVIPANSQIKSAVLDVTAVGAWIPMTVTIYGDKSGKTSFSTTDKISDRALTASSQTFTDNVKWTADQVYSYDVTSQVAEAVGAAGSNGVSLIIKGGGTAYGRKYVYGPTATGKSPKLHVTYVDTVTVLPTATTSPTSFPTTTAPSPTTKIMVPTPTVVIPTALPTAVPTIMPTAGATVSPTSMTGESIYGAVSTDILGTCPTTVHDRYVTRGPDGKLYRTWHPQTVPVDMANPTGAKCTFAHEHGDDPATSHIFAGAVPFDYVAAMAGMDEPHVGFKCFVHNKGTVNDEGSAALMDTYYCFHMGTGGAARFSTRFHSLDFHALSANGAVMNIQGLADVGNVGTICDNPRQSRTVMGLGCKVDSGYEIWSNTLEINNKGNVVARAVTSTAVFDPITVMDPANLTRVVYAWDPDAMSQVFKFNDNNSYFRGCNREAYSGPLNWYNVGGGQTYYTDVYGNVSSTGVLKQTISTVRTSQAGAVDQFGGLIMTYKSGNTGDPQEQFKYHKSACAPGLGLKN